MASASTRLRKTFKYPSDDEGSADSHDEMDEQEQESLITSLRAREDLSNAQYTLIFTILPLTATPVFIYYLFAASSLRSTPLLCLLALTSLAASSYTMRFIPLYAASSPSRAQLARPALFVDSESPVQTLLPWLNGAIAGLLLFASWAVKGRANAPEGMWLVLCLPAVMLGVVAVARKSMKDVMVGLGELEGRRYELKGA
jgi:hypothetical protein